MPTLTMTDIVNLLGEIRAGGDPSWRVESILFALGERDAMMREMVEFLKRIATDGSVYEPEAKKAMRLLQKAGVYD